jgi:hypothetical protein
LDRVGGEDLVAHVQRLNQPSLDRGALIKPVICIGDLTVATACCLGRANAMNDLWIYAEPSMTRAAMARLPETLALTWTRRYWTQLERASRSEEGRGVARYDGSRPIRLWIVEELLGTLEAERAAGRLTIRREQLGRPAALPERSLSGKRQAVQQGFRPSGTGRSGCQSAHLFLT